VVETLSFLLLNDESAYVRHCAGGALGCAGIRAFAHRSGLAHLASAVAAIVQSLAVEENRLDVSLRQGLGLKECSPDDLCDMCEGSTWHVGDGYASEPRLQVRKAPTWPRSWANFCRLQLYSYMNA
jgi:hypothetical protein